MTPWHAVDQSTVAARRPEVLEHAVDDDLVLYGYRTGSALSLNTTGALVWHLLDGEADVATLADDVAEAFGVDPDRAVADIVRFVKDLGRHNLLAGIQGVPPPGTEGC